MKIAYCIPSTYNSGGMERILSIKANFFARKGDDVYIITTNQKGREAFYQFEPSIRHIDLDIDYEAIKNLPLLTKIKQRIKIKKKHIQKLESLLMDLRPDITISMFTHEITFLPNIQDGSKKVLELHFSKSFRKLDAESNGVPYYLRIINSLLDWHERRCIRKYDKFVVLTARDANDWGNHYHNITHIPNPSPYLPEKRSVYTQKKALAIGRLCPQKGFDLLIDAWLKVADKSRKDWKLDIVGSGPDQERLQNKIDNYKLSKQIEIMPPAHNMEEIYKSHSLFCFSSRYEGYGLVLVEASSFGLAPISFDCPCGPSELITDKVNGRLISPFDTEAFAQALENCMIDENKRLFYGKNAAESVRKNFSQDVIMSKWTQLFDSLINKFDDK